MSSFEPQDRARSVIPRWRSFLNTPSLELQTIDRFPKHNPILPNSFFALIEEWRAAGQPEDAADIMDAGIASGCRDLVTEGAKRLVKFGKSMVLPRVLERAHAFLEKAPSDMLSSHLPEDEIDKEIVHKKISRLKNDIAKYPRNSLAHVEIARLYARIAQFSHAEHHIRIALNVDPDDRFVLRSMTRLFTMSGGHLDALKILRRSDRIKYDPWIQSAELATAVIGKYNPREGASAASRLLDQLSFSFSSAELLSGWVTHKYNSGIPRKKALRFLNNINIYSTENALAQSIWFADKIGDEFRDIFPEIKIKNEAHEALSMSLVEEGRPDLAVVEAKKWFWDQPFQARSAVQVAYINFVWLENYEEALKYAKLGLDLHPHDWGLTNFGAISAIRDGKIDEGEQFLAKFSKIASNEESKIFYVAAEGMLAFQKGNYPSAIQKYIESIKAAKQNGLPHLAVNAAVYLMEMAILHKVVSEDDIKNLEDKIEYSINRLSRDVRKGINEIWRARKLAISRIRSAQYKDNQELLPFQKIGELLTEK